MSNDMNFSDYAASMEAEVTHLRSKSEGDDEMIMLLKRQLETQGMHITKMAHDHAEELRLLQARCDLAVRREKEINGILNTAASGIVMGLRKMKGDDTPPKIPERRGEVVDHELLPRNEPMVPPEVAEFAPKPFIRPRHNDEIDDGLRQIVGRLR